MKKEVDSYRKFRNNYINEEIQEQELNKDELSFSDTKELINDFRQNTADNISELLEDWESVEDIKKALKIPDSIYIWEDDIFKKLSFMFKKSVSDVKILDEIWSDEGRRFIFKRYFEEKFKEDIIWWKIEKVDKTLEKIFKLNSKVLDDTYLILMEENSIYPLNIDYDKINKTGDLNVWIAQDLINSWDHKILKKLLRFFYWIKHSLSFNSNVDEDFIMNSIWLFKWLNSLHALQYIKNDSQVYYANLYQPVFWDDIKSFSNLSYDVAKKMSIKELIENLQHFKLTDEQCEEFLMLYIENDYKERRKYIFKTEGVLFENLTKKTILNVYEKKILEGPLRIKNNELFNLFIDEWYDIYKLIDHFEWLDNDIFNKLCLVPHSELKESY